MTDEQKARVAAGARRRWKSKEQRRIVSERMTGRKHSEETKSKISKKMTGRKHSEETKEKISESGCRRFEKKKSKDHLTGGKNARAKAAVCLTNSKKFNCVSDAAKWLRSIGHKKATATNISLACKGKYKRAYGFEWRYLEAKL